MPSGAWCGASAVQNYKGDSNGSSSSSPLPTCSPSPRLLPTRHGALRVPVRPRALHHHAGKSPSPARENSPLSLLCRWLICSAPAPVLPQVSSSLPLTLALRRRPEAHVPRQFRPSTACSWPRRPLLPELAAAAGARGTGRARPLFRPRASTRLFLSFFLFLAFFQQFDFAHSNYLFKFPWLELD